MNELGFIDVSPIALLQIVAAYILGSIAFGILISKLFGLPDPRTVGSGNPGATNVLRSGKKSAAALTLLGDAFKGWFPVWFVMQPDGGLMCVTSAVAIAVFVGHLYPVFYKFKGGKGVATALGILLAISPWLEAYRDYEIVFVFLAVMLVWRHRTNIQKLLNGTESGFGKK